MQKKEELIKKLKLISMLIGGLALIGTGLLYAVVTDLVFKNSSYWLFFAIVSALASGVIFLLADKFPNKKVLFYVLKGVGLFFALFFICVILAYHGSSFVNSITGISGPKFNKRADREFCENFSLVITILGSLIFLVQASNVTLNAVFGLDE